MLETLEGIRVALAGLRRDVKRERGSAIGKRAIREAARAAGERWFSEAAPVLSSNFGISSEIVERYAQGFRRLIKISAPNNLKSSYEETLGSLLRRFRDELILPIQTRPAEVEEVTALET